jgi:hypothetical protein
MLIEINLGYGNDNKKRISVYGRQYLSYVSVKALYHAVFIYLLTSQGI